MNTATNLRLIVTKAVLWFVGGVATIVGVVRFIRGLGATTALTDTTPWGMWIGFDVLAGVALAGGGFVIAATVHIFGRERYHGIVRPAILTAFLGYLGVIIGLIFDLGRPWNIWRPMFYWNTHSPLFEVAVCVILYTAVLALEFAPVALEGFPRVQPIVRWLRKLTLPIVIAGIGLSTLHQSSLGTLFLLSEGRMHPLWYAPLLPPLFLISAVGLGLGMVSLESMISSWLYRRRCEWEQLRGLTGAAAVVLSLYLVMRLGDLIVRGKIGYAFDGSWFATLFWTELILSSMAPILLFGLPRLRGKPWAIAWGSVLTVGGFIMHRADVGGISHIAVTGQLYVPAFTEIAVSLGVVSGLALVFLFFVEHLQVWEEKPVAPDHFTPPAYDPLTSLYIRSPWFGAGQRAALTWIAGIICGVVLLEAQLAARRQSVAQPVRSPRNVQVARSPRDEGRGHVFQLTAAGGESLLAGDEYQNALLIDSGGAGRFVLFEHDTHQQRLGGKTSCPQCHHRNVPLDNATSCALCHRDMYRTTDTFVHARHVTAHGGKPSCAVCHPDPGAAKNRASSKACNSCHLPLPQAATLVRSSEPAREPGLAPGYKTALHGLCIPCHQSEEAKKTAQLASQTETAEGPPAEMLAGVEEPYLIRCTTCHRTTFADESELRRRAGWSVVTAGLPPAMRGP